MAIAAKGKLFDSKFGERVEKKFELTVGSLPVAYSVLARKRVLSSDDKYNLTTIMTKPEHDEIRTLILEGLEEINVAQGLGASSAALKKALEQYLSESIQHPDRFRLTSSKRMTYRTKATGELAVIDMKVYKDDLLEENLMPNGVYMEAGSMAKAIYTVGLYKDGSSVRMTIQPQIVVVTKLIEREKRPEHKPSFDGVEDSSNAYDF